MSEDTTPTTEPKTDAAAEAPTQDSKPAAAAAEGGAQGGNNAGGRNDRNNNDNKRGGRGGGGRNNRRRNDAREPKEFEESVVGIDRVTRVTAGGRQLRFRVSVVIGDKKGRIGFGIAKSEEVVSALQKAIKVAKKSLFRVPIYEDSIPHEVVSDFKASRLILMPAPAGKGIIAGGPVRIIMDLAGVQNVLSKLHGSRNKINVVYATLKALKSLKHRAPKKVEKVEEPTAEEPAAEAPAAEKPKKVTAPKKAAPKKKAAAKA